MKINSKYGYKISYQEFGNSKLKVHLVTNTLDGAVWNIMWYENHPQQDRFDKHFLINPTWYLNEVKTKNEYEKLWKDCPFKEEF